MREARRVLKRRGELRLEVPNAVSLSARLLKPYWTGIAEPRHFFHFSPRTLALVLRTAGWTDFHIRTIPKGTWWASGLRHRTEVVRGHVPERPWFERRPARSAFRVGSPKSSGDSWKSSTGSRPTRRTRPKRASSRS